MLVWLFILGFQEISWDVRKLVRTPKINPKKSHFVLKYKLFFIWKKNIYILKKMIKKIIL